MKMNKKGSVMFYISFIIASIMILCIAAFAAPMGVRFNTEMYTAGQEILNDTISEIVPNINDPTIATNLNNTIVSARDAAVYNIEVSSAMYQYGWLLVIALTAVILFIYTRRVVEYTGGLV